MEKLVSSWCSTIQSLPKNYVFPVDERPGLVEFPLCKNIPVIDLGKVNTANDQSQIIQEILFASQEFGFFQVINHGVCEDLIDDTMRVVEDFFSMPDTDKVKVYSDDRSKSCRLYTSSVEYANEVIHLWRDALKHPCYPIDEWIHLWPEKPTRYRDVVRNYSTEVRNLSLRILEMMRQGLGLEPGFFGEELTGGQLMSVNHYPPCPEPGLTLGLRKHSDPNVITILQQGNIYGLQVWKDGQWLAVEPLPHAFVINVGHQLQIITNGMLRSAEHRAVANSRHPRTSIASFINPRPDTIIQPAKSLLDESHAFPLYRSFHFKEFVRDFEDKKGDTDAVMETYKFQP